MSSIVPMDDDDDTSDNNNDTDNIVISNLEILHDKMSHFESSFFDTIEHPSDLDNKALFLLDIQHPINKIDNITNETDIDPPAEDNLNPFNNILHDDFALLWSLMTCAVHLLSKKILTMSFSISTFLYTTTLILHLTSLPMQINFGLPLKVHIQHMANLFFMLIPLVTAIA